jgi:hypothetical protein
MDCRYSVLKAQAQLGFNFGRGLSREDRARKTDETGRLPVRIREINEAYGHLNLREIRNSEDFRLQAEQLFHDIGPALWPDFDKINGPFPPWLLRPGRPTANDNKHRDLYPEPLFFSDYNDRTL